jgi:hypothetical protein
MIAADQARALDLPQSAASSADRVDFVRETHVVGDHQVELIGPGGPKPSP